MAFDYEVIERIGVLSDSASGWTKELTVIPTDNRESKFDIRDWNEDHTKMSKGITLTKEELQQLVKISSDV